MRRSWKDGPSTDFSDRSPYENGHDDYDEEVERFGSSPLTLGMLAVH